MTYSALTHYTDPDVVDRYERDRYGTPLGRHRWRVEQRGVGSMLDRLPGGQEILDCPSGNGRWAQALLRRGHTVVCGDVSGAMLWAARTRLAGPLLLGLCRMDAERLPLADRGVDFVFCHALTKHLPPPVQDRVFAEFARVARSGVLCSFSVLSGPSALLWRSRRIPEAYGRTPAELTALAHRHGMAVRASSRCSTSLGVERTVLFERA